MDHTLADQLRARGVRGVLVLMAESGYIDELRCEMRRCYCPNGREYVETRSRPPGRWAPSADHHPILKCDGGHLVPGNVRLSHTLCNNLDYAWKKLPVERRAAAVARWRKKYLEASPANAHRGASDG